MGWGDCGQDSQGRPIGYYFEATCDEPGCERKIDRGLSYACGGMHGENEYDCEKYFCGEHLYFTDLDNVLQLCKECSARVDYEEIDED